jgi:hypothetical protein
MTIIAGDAVIELYVQLKRLHGSLRLGDVVVALQEALVNLVGTEEFALFLRDADSGRFEKLASTGARARSLGSFTDEEPPIAVSTVPLRSAFSEEPMGAVVIAGLLAHKGKLDERDHALLRELCDHAGIAIEAALAVEAAGPQTIRVSEVRARLEGVVDLDVTVPLAGEGSR